MPGLWPCPGALNCDLGKAADLSGPPLPRGVGGVGQSGEPRGKGREVLVLPRQSSWRRWSLMGKVDLLLGVFSV